MSRRVLGRSCWLLALLGLSTPLAAATYLPLLPGSSWSYAGDLGSTQEITCTGTTELAGETVSVLRYSGYEPDAGLENYWTATDDGDVLLWGYFRPDEGWGLLYQPPLPVTQGTLAAGQRWSFSAEISSLPDYTVVGSIAGERVVTGEGLETVPAGEFYAFAVAWDFGEGFGPKRGEQRVDVAGRTLLPGRDPSPPDYYVADLGEIRYEVAEIWRLTAYSASTATAMGSWGGIKALY